MDRRIKIRHIQCFVEIAREGSLKQAADKLFLTQPAISKTLKELEDILGNALMLRSRAGIELTEHGQVFLHFARQSLASLQQGLDGIEAVDKDGGQRLRVGSLPSVAASLMPDVVAAFSELAPNATLTIVDGPHGYLMERLRLAELDLVIGRLGAPDTMTGVSFTQLYTEKVVLVARPDHPMTLAPSVDALKNWQILVPPHGSAIRPLVDRFLISNGVGELPQRIETVSGAFGRVYTRNSDAIWIISGGVVAREIADGRLVQLPFDTDITQGPVGLMTRPDSSETGASQVFRLAVDQVLERNGLIQSL